MVEKVIMITRNQKEANQLSQLLTDNQYQPLVLSRTEELSQDSVLDYCMSAILDFDSLDLDNKTIRKLTIQYPQICFLGMSKDTFHPELKDAICYHIYACLNKPIDSDELLYWLKCIAIQHDENG